MDFSIDYDASLSTKKPSIPEVSPSVARLSWSSLKTRGFPSPSREEFGFIGPSCVVDLNEAYSLSKIYSVC